MAAVACSLRTARGLGKLREVAQTSKSSVTLARSISTRTLPLRMPSLPISSSKTSQASPSSRGLASSASTTTPRHEDTEDLVTSSSFSRRKPTGSVIADWDPLASSRGRKRQLPPSRYKFRPPKYYRGPLHPHQPPKASDPASREFIPGPFSVSRGEQMYTSTVEPDLMTLMYQHLPPGYEAPPRAPRLRSWDDSSPYHKNRPLRAPRGRGDLRLIRKRITFRTIPKLEAIVIHSYVKTALVDDNALHVSNMVLQAITGARFHNHKSKGNEAKWSLRDGIYVAASATLKGAQMYDFLSKTVDIVLPRIRDWKGVDGSSGDLSGNISFGFTPDVVAMYPEIEINYDAYPPKMIPGCHITIQTSAATNKDARLLLMSFGIPFHGKFVN